MVNDDPRTGNTPLSAEQFSKEMKSLVQAIQENQKNLILSKNDGFFTSGMFFILLGLVFLVAAYAALERGVHSSFSFVLVVLGVAILLFGTGTQGIGKLESGTDTAKFNIAIAGGAGALAILIGWGMTYFGPKMQLAFGQETRYVAAELRPHADANSTFVDYWGQFEVEGKPIPSVHQGDYFFAYVPYLETERDRVKHVGYKLTLIDTKKPDPNLKPLVSDVFDVQLSKVNLNNSGADFPIYDQISPIDMRNAAALNAVLQAGGSQRLDSAPGAAQPDAPPPVALGGQ